MGRTSPGAVSHGRDIAYHRRRPGRLQRAPSGVVSDIYEALAAPARRAILDELYDRDGQTLFELCTRLVMKHGMELTRQAVSQHLAVLESAGLVSTEREGRYKFHYLDTGPLRAIPERWPPTGPQESER